MAGNVNDGLHDSKKMEKSRFSVHILTNLNLHSSQDIRLKIGIEAQNRRFPKVLKFDRIKPKFWEFGTSFNCWFPVYRWSVFRKTGINSTPQPHIHYQVWGGGYRTGYLFQYTDHLYS